MYRVLVEALAARLLRMTDALVEALYLPAETRLLHRLAEIAQEWNWGDERGLRLRFGDISDGPRCT